MYSTHDPRAPATLRNHVPRAFPNFPPRQPRRAGIRVIIQEPRNQLDAIRDDGPGLQQVGEGLDVLVLAAQGLVGELGAERGDGGMDQAACPREGVEGVEVEGAGDLRDDPGWLVRGSVPGERGYARVAVQSRREGALVRVFVCRRAGRGIRLRAGVGVESIVVDEHDHAGVGGVDVTD